MTLNGPRGAALALQTLILCLLLGSSLLCASAQETPPRSVILLVGDGMGVQQVGLLVEWAHAANRHPTSLERLHSAGAFGLLRTAALGAPITDSAAAATALATGMAVRNGVISLDPDGQPLRTCLEAAQGSGRRVGLVTSTTLTHATPAAFAAHVGNRVLEKEIARQLLDSGADVLFGGGAEKFLGDPSVGQQNLADQIESRAYRVVRCREELKALPADTPRSLGLFSDSHLPYVLDRDQPGESVSPTLPELTRKALEILGRDDGAFFLMVEGGRIDHAGHINDAPSVLAEMREFDDCVGVALEFRAENPDTLVIVTADHETGGMSVSTPVAPFISSEDLLELAAVKESAEKLEQEVEVEAERFGVGRSRFYPPGVRGIAEAALERSARFNVTFGSYMHTAAPVPVYAQGPGQDRFLGYQSNTIVGRHVVEWMAKPLVAPRD